MHENNNRTLLIILIIIGIIIVALLASNQSRVGSYYNGSYGLRASTVDLNIRPSAPQSQVGTFTFTRYVPKQTYTTDTTTTTYTYYYPPVVYPDGCTATTAYSATTGLPCIYY